MNHVGGDLDSIKRSWHRLLDACCIEPEGATIDRRAVIVAAKISYCAAVGTIDGELLPVVRPAFERLLRHGIAARFTPAASAGRNQCHVILSRSARPGLPSPRGN